MTATATPKAARRPNVVNIACDLGGTPRISLSKPAASVLAKARDVCAVLAASAPTLQSKAKGIQQAIESLMADIAAGGPLPPDEPNDDTDVV